MPRMEGFEACFWATVTLFQVSVSVLQLHRRLA